MRPAQGELWLVERPQYSALIGQGLDMDSATSGRAPLPWEVELPPSCVFKEEVRVVTVPHTGVVKTCHKCRGNGGMTCNECYGKVGARVVTVWYLVWRMWWWSGRGVEVVTVQHQGLAAGGLITIIWIDHNILAPHSRHPLSSYDVQPCT